MKRTDAHTETIPKSLQNFVWWGTKTATAIYGHMDGCTSASLYYSQILVRQCCPKQASLPEAINSINYNIAHSSILLYIVMIGKRHIVGI